MTQLGSGGDELNRESAAGIVLCGGASSRMGTSKAWLRVRGETFLERTVATLAACTSRVIVAAAPGQDLPALKLSVCRLDDALPGQGPLPALAGALKYAAAQGHQRALVLGVDFPLFSAEMGLLLLRQPDASHWAAVAAPDGRIQPLAAAYLSVAGNAFEELFSSGVHSLTAALCQIPHIVVGSDLYAAVPPGELAFQNLNTPEQYQALRGT